jgi:glycosyltransferase involved in cell wall biosynthesis
VHASIVEAGKQNNAITFITSISENTAFLQQFSKYSTVIEINELLKIGFTERWLMKKIKQIAANNEALRVFGCNSPFFYQLIPYLNNSTIVIDLIHAFVHRYEDGAEKWSLPHVRRIDHRIVISQHSKNDLVQMYKEKGIPESFLSQIEVIPNFVENDQKLNLNSCLDHNKKILKVAYIGRAGEEKRVNLIAKLAKNMSGKAIEFHFVGNLKPFIENEFREYCTFHGEITDDQRLNELYNDFNLVLIASSREGFPMVIMEAMIHGAIPISTNVGGIPEHIKNNENGFLIESTDENEIVNDFEKKILYLVDNRQELIRLSNNVFQYAVNTFSKEKFINAYSKLLKSKS